MHCMAIRTLETDAGRRCTSRPDVLVSKPLCSIVAIVAQRRTRKVMQSMFQLCARGTDADCRELVILALPWPIMAASQHAAVYLHDPPPV